MNKVTIVTGASSGFSALGVRALAEAGHTIFAGMRDAKKRNAPRVDEIADWTGQTGHALRPLELDVQSDREVGAAINIVLAQCGRVAALAHNAGLMVQLGLKGSLA